MGGSKFKPFLPNLSFPPDQKYFRSSELKLYLELTAAHPKPIQSGKCRLTDGAMGGEGLNLVNFGGNGGH